MRRLLRLVLAGAVLWALFLPATEPAENRLVLELRPPALAVLLIAALAAAALAGWRVGRGQRRALAALLVALAGLQLASVLVLSFLDRALDLYFDVAQVPSLVGLFTDAVGPWRAAAALVLAPVAAVALLAAVTWAVGQCQRAVAPLPRAALVLALVVLAAGVVPLRGRTLVAFAAPADAADQAARLTRATAVLAGLDHRYDAALAQPAPTGDLAGLAGHDVFVVFVESYGTLLLDDPRFRATVAPALGQFDQAVARAGYGMVSSRLVSPVFGAGSWLAHGTLGSGLKLDPFLYRRLTASGRAGLPRYFHAAGYRTVAVMPGIKKAWPEGAFWGFDASYVARNLGYDGPGFGWFAIPDQYSLARFDAAELEPGHAPVFAEIVLVSSHTPFAPVPPYVADWGDAGPYKSVSPADWQAIYREPDWAHLDRPYLASVVYDLRTLAGWLERLDGAPLVVILGDHQPPGMASGATTPWTVPIHVLSRDKALLAPFARAGYVAGALPPPGAMVKGMESFLGDFLAFFSAGGASVRAGS